LDLNALAISDAWETVSSAAQAQLDRQMFLLQSVDGDLWTLSRSKVHLEFLTPAHRKTIEGSVGAQQRTLADYVSNAKMRQVADACQRIHGK
jgi:autophagy-related protein 11